MDNTLLTGLSSQMVMRRNMDMVANNLANTSTTAYKSETVLFEEYLVPITDDEGKESLVHLVQDYGNFRNTNEGSFEFTANPLDVALRGDGYFAVEAPDTGERYFTRAGHFNIDDQGRLATAAGDLVLNENDRPITFAQGETEIEIALDGTLSSSGGVKGRIQAVTFTNEQDLQKAGNNRYSSEEAPTPAESVEFVQGMIEGSNVNSILEMTRMIQISRAYQSASKLMQSNDDLVRKAIETLGKT